MVEQDITTKINSSPADVISTLTEFIFQLEYSNNHALSHNRIPIFITLKAGVNLFSMLCTKIGGGGCKLMVVRCKLMVFRKIFCRTGIKQKNDRGLSIN